MKRNGIIVIIVIVAIIGILAFFKLNGSKNEAGPKGGGKAAAPASNATAYVVKPVELENNVQASGTVLANEEVELRSEINGKVEGIYFKEGGKVAKGQLLVKLNDADLQAQMQKLKYQQDIADKRFGRIKQLREKEGVSQEEYDVSQSELNTLKADVSLVAAQIAKTRIVAPFSGVVGLRYISVGSYVSPTVSITSLQDIEPVKIDFSLPEKYASRVQLGDPLSYTVQGQDKVYKAKVYAIEPKIDVATRSVMIRALAPNGDNKALPGAFASVQLELKAIDAALMVPTESIIPELKGQKVIVAEGGKAAYRTVETGIRTDKDVQITAGLKAGDTVITTGLMMLRPGMKLNLTEVK